MTKKQINRISPEDLSKMKIIAAIDKEAANAPFIFKWEIDNPGKPMEFNEVLDFSGGNTADMLFIEEVLTPVIDKARAAMTAPVVAGTEPPDILTGPNVVLDAFYKYKSEVVYTLRQTITALDERAKLFEGLAGMGE